MPDPTPEPAGVPADRPLTDSEREDILRKVLSGGNWRELAEHYQQPGWNIRNVILEYARSIEALVALPRDDPATTPHDPAKHFHFEKHEDDERIDSVTIETVPRWKESEMSGDEWRFSYRVTFWYKGQPVRAYSRSRIEWAMGSLIAESYKRSDGEDEELQGLSDDERVAKLRERRDFIDEFCFNPGCTEAAVVEYRKIKDWCHTCGNAGDKYAGWDARRRFCGRHMRRGDCGLDDSDANYVLVRSRDMDSADWQALEVPMKLDGHTFQMLWSTYRGS